jgi:hypothetical protein
LEHLIEILSGQPRRAPDQWTTTTTQINPKGKGQQLHDHILPSKSTLETIASSTSSPLKLMEDKWWRLWRLELKCIQCKTFLYQALLYFMNGRYVKGAMSLSKCHGLFREIGSDVKSETSFGSTAPGSAATLTGRPMDGGGGLPGSFGEVVYMLKAGIMETQTLVSSVFCLLPSLVLYQYCILFGLTVSSLLHEGA